MDAVELGYPVDDPILMGSEGFGRARVSVNEVEASGCESSGRASILVNTSIEHCSTFLRQKGIGEAKMNWPSRLKVAVGAARGLAYLHSSSAVGIPIVHRDFKSTNVLLSSNFEAKAHYEI